MRWIIALVVCFLPTLAHAADFEFPNGVPIKASEVEFYPRSTLMQDGILEGFHQFRQTWNREFPWITGGVDKSDNVQTFKFHRAAKAGSMYWWTEYSDFFSNGNQRGFIKFSIPKGELFGEVIQVDGRTTEVRFLEGSGTDDPKFRAFRPFSKREELLPFIVKENTYRDRLTNRHPITVLDETALVDDIELSPEGVQNILARPFKDITDVVFSEGTSGSKCFCPTTSQRNGVVGRFSQGGFLRSETCVHCHRTAGEEGRLIDPSPTPDKYGNIRGGGGVFSAPFAQWMREGKIKQHPNAPQSSPHFNDLGNGRSMREVN